MRGKRSGSGTEVISTGSSRDILWSMRVLPATTRDIIPNGFDGEVGGSSYCGDVKDSPLHD